MLACASVSCCRSRDAQNILEVVERTKHASDCDVQDVQKLSGVVSSYVEASAAGYGLHCCGQVGSFMTHGSGVTALGWAALSRQLILATGSSDGSLHLHCGAQSTFVGLPDLAGAKNRDSHLALRQHFSAHCATARWLNLHNALLSRLDEELPCNSVKALWS